MQRLWRQIIALLMVVGFICTAILLIGSQLAKKPKEEAQKK